MFPALGRLSLTAKIAAAAIGAGLIGIAVTTYSTSLSASKSLTGEFADARAKMTELVATAAEGGIKWKKADVVSATYARFFADTDQPVAYVVVVAADGSVIASQTLDGVDAAPIDAAAKSLAADAVKGNHVSDWLGADLLVASPSGKDKAGAPLGAVVVAWRGASLASSAWSLGVQLTVTLAVSILAIAGIIVFLLVRVVTGPLMRMKRRIEALAAGDTDSEVPESGRGDEIGAIAEAVTVLREGAEVRKRLEAEQERSLDAQRAREASMAALASEFRASVTNMQATVAEQMGALRTAANHINATAGDTRSRATVMKEKSDRVSEDVRSVSEATGRLEQSLAVVRTQIDSTTEAVAGAGRDAEVSSERMTELSSAAARIGTVVDLIRDIASQTNLLALNATIEAARAGEAGRGFAVVASEVKDLAGQTAKATDDIAEQISQIQATTASAEEALRAVTHRIGSMRGLSDSLGSAVADQMTVTLDIGRGIATAADGTGAAATEMESVRNASDQTVRVADQVNATADAVGRSVDAFGEIVETYLRSASGS